MGRPYLTPEAMPDELGTEMAARIAGIPRATLCLHITQRKVMGVRKTPSGRRVISREGLLAYLQARGIEPEYLKDLERRRAVRASNRFILRARLELPDPGDPSRLLGYGDGSVSDLSASGLRFKVASWTGYLPGEDSEIRFKVMSDRGRLQGGRGRASLAWVLRRGGEFQMGLRLLHMEGRGARTRWEGFVRMGREDYERRIGRTFA